MEINRSAGSSLLREWFALNNAAQFEAAIALAKRVEDDSENALLRPYGETLRRVAEIRYACFQDAEATFQRALAAGGPREDAWIALGEVMLDLDLMEKADDCFQKALAINPEAATALIGLGLVKCAATEKLNVEDALYPLQRATELVPGLEAAWFYFGFALNQCGRFADALQCFDYILNSLNASNHWAWYAKGLTLDDMNDAAAAEQCYAEATRLDPEKEAAASCEAVRLSRQGRSNRRPCILL
jgi:tetratricopeptide (TPR) repeat protein